MSENKIRTIVKYLGKPSKNMGIYGQNTHPNLFSYQLLIEAKKLQVSFVLPFIVSK